MQPLKEDTGTQTALVGCITQFARGEEERLASIPRRLFTTSAGVCWVGETKAGDLSARLNLMGGGGGKCSQAIKIN